jgi:hypothetical protein
MNYEMGKAYDRYIKPHQDQARESAIKHYRLPISIDGDSDPLEPSNLSGTGSHGSGLSPRERDEMGSSRRFMKIKP